MYNKLHKNCGGEQSGKFGRKTEVLDGADELAESQNNLELNDIKGNNITIEDAKATLTHSSDLIQGAINGESKAFNELYLQS